MNEAAQRCIACGQVLPLKGSMYAVFEGKDVQILDMRIDGGGFMNLQVGDIYRYRMENMWCRHGIAVVLPSGELKDTYWRGLMGVDTSNYGHVRESLVSPENRVGNVEEFISSNQRDINLFADKDTLWIPVGGGSREFWVRKDAKPDPTISADFLRSQIEQQRGAIRSAEWSIERLQEELKQYESLLPSPAASNSHDATESDAARNIEG